MNPNYDFTTRNIPQAWWGWFYRDVLVDLQESKRLIPATPIISEGAKKNRIAILQHLVLPRCPHAAHRRETRREFIDPLSHL